MWLIVNLQVNELFSLMNRNDEAESRFVAMECWGFKFVETTKWLNTKWRATCYFEKYKEAIKRV